MWNETFKEEVCDSYLEELGMKARDKARVDLAPSQVAIPKSCDNMFENLEAIRAMLGDVSCDIIDDLQSIIVLFSYSLVRKQWCSAGLMGHY
jgi:hypothetical protein